MSRHWHWPGSAEVGEVGCLEIATTIEDVGGQRAFAAQQGVQLDVEAREPVADHAGVIDIDGAGLADPVCTRRGLIFLGGVPCAGEMDWAAAASVDTDLSFLSFLELYGTDIAERRMPPRRVVEPLDVVEHVGSGLLPGAVHLSGRPLGFH